MKKNLIILLSFVTVLLAGCFDSNGQITKIEWENVVNAQQTFNNQLDETQYIKDLEDFLSYNVLSITQDKPFTSDFNFSIKFDENSSIDWWVDFTQNKVSKAHDLESADIIVDIKADRKDGSSDPFGLHWDVTLVYKDNEMYAKLHKLDVSMWEGNMVAKMYTLLWDLLVNNRVNLEVHEWWFITLDEGENKRLPYIVSTVKNVLKTEGTQDSPNFLWSTAEFIDAINSYVDLWISIDELRLTNQEVAYYQLWDKSIQKLFTWSFEWKDTAFDMFLDVSKKWVKMHLYNIKQYNSDVQNLENTDFIFSLQEVWKSDYSVNFQSLQSNQVVFDLQWKVKYSDMLSFSADFDLEPSEITDWQKISWELGGSIVKKSESDKNIPEITWDVLSLTELLSSL